MPAIKFPALLDLSAPPVGERLLLRPYRAGDGAAFFAAVNEDRAELARWVSWVDQYKNVDDAESYVRRMAAQWQKREALILGIFAKDGQTLYGGTGFHGFDWEVPSLEMGWFLRPSARGRGVATEAVQLACQLAFEQIGANRVWGTVDVQNERSWRLFERAGFTREASLRSECRDHRGTLRDTFVYGMLSREWNQRNPSRKAA